MNLGRGAEGCAPERMKTGKDREEVRESCPGGGRKKGNPPTREEKGRRERRGL